jgi:hypothetical protein
METVVAGIVIVEEANAAASEIEVAVTVTVRLLVGAVAGAM